MILILFLILFYLGQNLSSEIPGSSSNVSSHNIKTSKIFCTGELLKDVQTMKPQIYSCSKDFTDRKMKFPEDTILSSYNKLKSAKKINFTTMRKFLLENFEDEPLDPWTPPDFTEEPSILKSISDPALRNWTKELNNIWKQLGLRTDPDIASHPEQYSQIYLPNGFMIPGGVYREMYYWDTYWVIKGLLLCDMTSTVRGIISNMLYLVSELGYMPNASRRYYLQRSQPPFLHQMGALYEEVTKDNKFITDNLEIFEKEFQWWMENRMVDVEINNKKYTLAAYKDYTFTPRPEAYYRDYIMATRDLKTEEEREHFYSEIKAAAESGYDFSSRWIVEPEMENGTSNNLANIRTSEILPVDLNCLLESNARILSQWFKNKGDIEKYKTYRKIANTFRQAIEEVFWHNEDGSWYDYDWVRGRIRRMFFGSNLTPLFTNSYPSTKRPHYARKIIQYLKNVGIFDEREKVQYYGVPTSLFESGEQWDFPNSWAPIQSMIINGLLDLNDQTASQMAEEIARKWIHTNYVGFVTRKAMFEKYKALILGSEAESSQLGFGWTNGVVLELLEKYGSKWQLDEILRDDKINTDKHVGNQVVSRPAAKPESSKLVRHLARTSRKRTRR